MVPPYSAPNQSTYPGGGTGSRTRWKCTASPLTWTSCGPSCGSVTRCTAAPRRPATIGSVHRRCPQVRWMAPVHSLANRVSSPSCAANATAPARVESSRPTMSVGQRELVEAHRVVLHELADDGRVHVAQGVQCAGHRVG